VFIGRASKSRAKTNVRGVLICTGMPLRRVDPSGRYPHPRRALVSSPPRAVLTSSARDDLLRRTLSSSTPRADRL